ncbi:hypothetical protein [Vibrio crassostreae]|uniref:hypothetical protein n=1 Tax=Vibrio crassostreae TaxID=246167 RepID=UPI001B306F32|nr:hypothetical protein [Vibrio crassostreae]
MMQIPSTPRLLPSIAEARRVVGAEPVEFDGEPYEANCCGSLIGRGNALNEVGCETHNGYEVDYFCCNLCLKRTAWFQIHQYDDIKTNEV